MKKECFVLKNKNGLELRFTNYGGIVTHLYTPDRDGQLTDIVLGFDDLDQYESDHPYFGAIVGRYGNRIAQGTFKIDNKQYLLAKNNGPNNLHGGVEGFHRKYWHVEELEGENGYRLSYLSPDGEEGFPGNLSVTVDYILTDDNRWIINYNATTDQKTVFNPTNHSYFNLNGADSGDILSHEIEIVSEVYTPVDEHMIPIGTFQSVKDTPFDFRLKKRIGKDINKDSTELKIANGYDHNFAFKVDHLVKRVAEVSSPRTGRRMTVYTDQPGMQFYCGNWLGGIVGKGNTTYENHHGFCLETQHYPDSPNQPDFPSTLLVPGEVYESKTIYEFGTL